MRSQVAFWHFCEVAADGESVWLSGQTGSDQTTLKTALLTHIRSWGPTGGY